MFGESTQARGVVLVDHEVEVDSFRGYLRRESPERIRLPFATGGGARPRPIAVSPDMPSRIPIFGRSQTP